MKTERIIGKKEIERKKLAIARIKQEKVRKRKLQKEIKEGIQKTPRRERQRIEYKEQKKR